MQPPLSADLLYCRLELAHYREDERNQYGCGSSQCGREITYDYSRYGDAGPYQHDYREQQHRVRTVYYVAAYRCQNGTSEYSPHGVYTAVDVRFGSMLLFAAEQPHQRVSDDWDEPPCQNPIIAPSEHLCRIFEYLDGNRRIAPDKERASRIFCQPFAGVVYHRRYEREALLFVEFFLLHDFMF